MDERKSGEQSEQGDRPENADSEGSGAAAHTGEEERWLDELSTRRETLAETTDEAKRRELISKIRDLEARMVEAGIISESEQGEYTVSPPSSPPPEESDTRTPPGTESQSPNPSESQEENTDSGQQEESDPTVPTSGDDMPGSSDTTDDSSPTDEPSTTSTQTSSSSSDHEEATSSEGTDPDDDRSDGAGSDTTSDGAVQIPLDDERDTDSTSSTPDSAPADTEEAETSPTDAGGASDTDSERESQSGTQTSDSQDDEAGDPDTTRTDHGTSTNPTGSSESAGDKHNSGETPVPGDADSEGAPDGTTSDTSGSEVHDEGASDPSQKPEPGDETTSGDESGQQDGVEDTVTTLREQIATNEDDIANLEQLFAEYKRANEHEHEELRKHAVEGFANNMLRVRDTLQRALELFEWDEKKQDQLEGIVDQFDQQFTSRDIEPIEPAVGTAFDYDRHELDRRDESPNYEEDAVIEVVEKGFVLSGRVIRPAKVVVAK